MAGGKGSQGSLPGRHDGRGGLGCVPGGWIGIELDVLCPSGIESSARTALRGLGADGACGGCPARYVGQTTSTGRVPI